MAEEFERVSAQDFSAEEALEAAESLIASPPLQLNNPFFSDCEYTNAVYVNVDTLQITTAALADEAGWLFTVEDDPTWIELEYSFDWLLSEKPQQAVPHLSEDILAGAVLCVNREREFNAELDDE